VQNVDPTLVNPLDPVAGFSGIARNMTGMAVHMQAAGYATAAVGKWDAGMATNDHTPKGRGYDDSLIYFHHANDYFQYTAGSCGKGVPGTPAREERAYKAQQRKEFNLPPLPAAGTNGDYGDNTCPSKFTILHNQGVCKPPSADVFHGAVSDIGACCAKCASLDDCVRWTFHPPNTTTAGTHGVGYACNATHGDQTPGRTSGCVGGGVQDRTTQER
jgi:hypothetical protein